VLSLRCLRTSVLSLRSLKWPGGLFQKSLLKIGGLSVAAIKISFHLVFLAKALPPNRLKYARVTMSR